MKELIAMGRIESALHKHTNPVVACSFGKDSEVILHLALTLEPDIPIVFNNTLSEYPDTLQLKRHLQDEWNLNLIEIKPENDWTFWKVVETYGFPIGQRRGISATSKCCYYLKKAPMEKALRENNWDLIIDGMTAYESRQRYFMFSRIDDDTGYRFNKQWKCHKLSPIWDWTPNDVWDYLEKFHLPYNTHYDKEFPDAPEMTKRGIWRQGYNRCLRVGCWACTIPIKYNPYYLKHLRVFYPRMYKLLLKRGLAEYLLEFGKGTEIYRHIDPSWIAEQRPCYFDINRKVCHFR